MKNLLLKTAFIVCLIPFIGAAARTCPKGVSLAIGTFTDISWFSNPIGEGVTLLKLSNSNLSRVAVFPKNTTGRNPSYLAIDKPYMFVATSNDPDGEATAMRRITFSPSSRVIKVDSVLSQAPTLTHIAVLPSKASRKIVIAASYAAGSIMSFISTPQKLVAADLYKVPAELASQVKHPDLPLYPQQSKPHAHMAFPYGEGALFPDLGTDLVYYMRISRTTGKFTLIDSIHLRPGDGVRHLAKHPKLDAVYAVNNNSLSLVVLRKSCGGKVLGECSRVQVASASDADNMALYAIRVSDDGRFVYVSVRLGAEDGRIVAFEVSEQTGDVLRKIGQWSSGGIRPRDFYLVGPVQDKGKCRSFVAVANTVSNNLALFERDEQSGKMDGKVAYNVEIGTPASVVQY